MTNVDWRKSYHLRAWAWATACEFVDEQFIINEAWRYYDALKLNKKPPLISLQVSFINEGKIRTIIPRDLISKDLLK